MGMTNLGNCFKAGKKYWQQCDGVHVSVDVAHEAACILHIRWKYNVSYYACHWTLHCGGTL